VTLQYDIEDDQLVSLDLSGAVRMPVGETKDHCLWYWQQEIYQVGRCRYVL